MARSARSSAPGLQRGDDLGVIREPMLDVLREDRPAIDNHVEGATPPRHNRRFEPELARNGSRQTGGLGSIVSTNAVFDGDLHADDHIGVRGPGSGSR